MMVSGTRIFYHSLLLFSCISLFFGEIAAQSVPSRLGEEGITEAILGGLVYLKEKQVTDNRYRVAPDDFRATEFSGHAAIRNFRCFLTNRVHRDTHVQGAWPAFVSFIPSRGIPKFQPLYTATDYNLFTTASTAHCLFYFDERGLPPEQRFLGQVKSNALLAIESFRRGDAYNFWPALNSKRYRFSYTGPPNIPIGIINLRKAIYDISGLLGVSKIQEGDLLTSWLRRIYDREDNRSGNIAMFNIPNDADDTSMAGIIQSLYRQSREPGSPVPDSAERQPFSLYRDTGRTRADRHGSILGPETGAFLTWLKEENDNVFDKPELGIIPLDANNVDITVNCNVLYCLALAGQTDVPGYRETVNLMIRAIREKIWPESSLYYPDKLWFPYSLTRAIRGGLSAEPELNAVLPLLLTDILNGQEAFELSHPGLEGAFPVFDSVSHVMSTALGLNILLNLGRDVAAEAGNVARYDKVILKSVKFLLDHSSAATDSGSNHGQGPVFWQSGPIYSASIKSLAHWYSNAQTTALVVEALAKYAMRYDTKPVPESGVLKLVVRDGLLSIKE